MQPLFGCPFGLCFSLKEKNILRRLASWSIIATNFCRAGRVQSTSTNETCTRIVKPEPRMRIWYQSEITRVDKGWEGLRWSFSIPQKLSLVCELYFRKMH